MNHPPQTANTPLQKLSISDRRYAPRAAGTGSTLNGDCGLHTRATAPLWAPDLPPLPPDHHPTFCFLLKAPQSSPLSTPLHQNRLGVGGWGWVVVVVSLGAPQAADESVCLRGVPFNFPFIAVHLKWDHSGPLCFPGSAADGETPVSSSSSSSADGEVTLSGCTQ